jgi:F-type H+-transporting ATPase subunit O
MLLGRGVGARSLSAAAAQAAQAGKGAAAAQAAQAGKAEGKAAAIKLPVQLYGLSARYANAVYVAATRAGSLDAVEADLQTVAGWQKSHKKFAEYVANPIISRTDKAADMKKITVGMNETTKGLLTVMAENGRLGELSAILKTFETLMSAKRGIVEATVTAAEPLSKEQEATLKQAITSGYLEKGQSLKMSIKIEPSIIAGLQVQIGDKFLDLAISSEINSVSKYL